MSTFNHISVHASDDDEEVFTVGLKASNAPTEEDSVRTSAAAIEEPAEVFVEETQAEVTPAPRNSDVIKPASTEKVAPTKKSLEEEYGLDVEPLSPLHKIFIALAVAGVIIAAVYILFLQ